MYHSLILFPPYAPGWSIRPQLKMFGFLKTKLIKFYAYS